MLWVESSKWKIPQTGKINFREEFLPELEAMGQKMNFFRLISEAKKFNRKQEPFITTPTMTISLKINLLQILILQQGSTSTLLKKTKTRNTKILDFFRNYISILMKGMSLFSDIGFNTTTEAFPGYSRMKQITIQI